MMHAFSDARERRCDDTIRDGVSSARAKRFSSAPYTLLLRLHFYTQCKGKREPSFFFFFFFFFFSRCCLESVVEFLLFFVVRRVPVREKERERERCLRSDSCDSSYDLSDKDAIAHSGTVLLSRFPSRR